MTEQQQQHPITPPPELVEQWYDAIDNSSTSWKQELATQAARWGADQKLEACVEWMRSYFHGVPQWADELRAAMRPKPLSLAEEALKILNARFDALPPIDAGTIRRALEQLDD